MGSKRRSEKSELTRMTCRGKSQSCQSDASYYYPRGLNLELFIIPTANYTSYLHKKLFTVDFAQWPLFPKDQVGVTWWQTNANEQ